MSTHRSLYWNIFNFTLGFSIISIFYSWLVFDFFAIRYLFVTLLSLAAIGFGYLTVPPRPSLASEPPKSGVKFDLFMCYLSIVSALGMLFDRIFFRGIDYFDVGLAAARAEFGATDIQGSAISVFGNIFSMAIYIPVMNNVYEWEERSKGRMHIFVATAAAMFLLTYITGGRTALMIMVAVIAAAFVGRGISGKSRLPSFFGIGKMLLSIVGVIFVFGFIFALRADAFGVANSSEYLASLCNHLIQPALEIVGSCQLDNGWAGQSGIMRSIVDYGSAVFLYAFHVVWISEGIIGYANSGPAISFVALQDIFLSRFGYIPPVTPYDGYFVAAASSIIYDYGYLSLAIFFGVLGALLRLFENGLKGGRLWTGRIFFTYCVATAYLSVMISPANLPFLVLGVFAAIMLAILYGLMRILVIRPNAVAYRRAEA